MELLAAHYSGGKPKETTEVQSDSLSHFLAIAASRGLGNGK